MDLEINDKLIRKGISKEVYFIVSKKHVNNILHYIIKSKNTGEIILSKFAIEKDFFVEKLMSSHDKQNFANAFSDRIKKLLKYK